MIIDSSIQGGGFGSRLLNLAKESNLALNGWVIDNDNELKQNGELYKSPIGFYRKNGFGILTDLKFDYQNIQGIKVKWQNPVFNK